ncbi:MAG: hypothetical protein LIO79_00250 [Rikenellaceae bacterium]|nr:hypothetical protein [Rikenellaceae bacterium]
MVKPNDIYVNFNRTPFLKLLPPLIIGVIIADSVNVDTITLFILYLLILAAFVVFRKETGRRILSFLLIFIIGMTSVQVLGPKEDIPRNIRIIAECKITDNLVSKGR